MDSYAGDAMQRLLLDVGRLSATRSVSVGYRVAGMETYSKSCRNDYYTIISAHCLVLAEIRSYFRQHQLVMFYML